MVRWGSARPPRHPTDLDATYHIVQATPIIFPRRGQPSSAPIPFRQRTHRSLDVATVRSFECRGDFAISNDASESMRIGTKPAADRSKPFQQFIANRVAPRDNDRGAIKSRPHTLIEAVDQVETTIVQPRRSPTAPDRAAIARRNSPNERPS